MQTIVMVRYIICCLIVVTLTQNIIAKPFSGNPFKRLEELYEQNQYTKLLQEMSTMERQGYYRKNHFHYRYKDNPAFCNLKIKANFQLLLQEKNPIIKHRMLEKVMKDFDHFTSVDKNKVYFKSDSSFYKLIKQYITKQADIDYQAGKTTSTEQYIQFIARNWQDTIAIYQPFYHPKSPSLDIKGNAFSVVDSFASAPIRFKLQSTKQLTKFLTDSLPSDLLKARAIYSYLAMHLSYDYESYDNGWHLNGRLDEKNSRLRPEGILLRAILIRKKGICSDFAQVFTEMCTYAGITSGKLHGWAKGSGWSDNQINNRINHAWNYIIVNQNTILLIDSCWASCTKELDFYFASNPSHFIYSHFPEDSLFQLLDKPISKEQFIQLPIGHAYEFRNKNSGYLEELKAQNKKVYNHNSVSVTSKKVTTKTALQ